MNILGMTKFRSKSAKISDARVTFDTEFLEHFLKKILFSGVKDFFSCIMISKMGVKMSFMIITKNHATDSKIRFPQKIDFRADGTHESHPAAWELNFPFRKICSNSYENIEIFILVMKEATILIRRITVFN